ncbi:alpha/beta fold hydrolase [Ornithinimicrobium avium]|uniref:alpha/beta fold hydrolase n=1 Tax=Ornithinimicrobium avium TaxID=2283195 RepID=UPI0013B362FA|nr:alpha/beta hydrolase [Ornithinimicrobium avium]
MNGPAPGPADRVEHGDPHGVAVLYLHGTPGSRVESRLLADAARRAGVRLIGVDRPGFGQTPLPGSPRLENWPVRVERLADRLGLDRFAVVGWSGGGVYALACVAALPDRISRVALVAPAGPGHGHGVGGWLETASSSLLATLAGVPGLVTLAGKAAGAARRLPPLRGRVPTPRTVRTLVAAAQHALRHGAAGWRHELGVLGEDWGPLVTSAREAMDARAAAGDPLPLTVWHGTPDRSVPVAEGRALAAALGALLVEDPDAGHVGVLVRHAAEVMEFLAGEAAEPQRSAGSGTSGP